MQYIEQSVEQSGSDVSTPPARAGLRSVSWPHLRILLMLGICGFPAVFVYAMSSGNQAMAHSRASATVAKVRVGRAPAEALMLVRSPQPASPAPAPKPVSAPSR